MSDAGHLKLWREASAHASGGTSGSYIKEALIAVLEDLPTPSSLLDYGAGKGELVAMLRGLLPGTRLVATDLMPRPGALDASIAWIQADLNAPIAHEPVDVVTCSEVIEHLENPRQTMRNLAALLQPGGTLILTTPNQESLRSLFALAVAGHHAEFLGRSYPAHITALLRMDITRIAEECGFEPGAFRYTNRGKIPKWTRRTWQDVSGGLLKGRLFSDNLVFVTRKRAL